METQRKYTGVIDAIDIDRYLRFDRGEWAELRAQTPLTLHEKDLEELRGINDRIDLDEVVAFTFHSLAYSTCMSARRNTFIVCRPHSWERLHRRCRT